MPRKGKGKGKQVETLKRRASTHNLRKLSTTVENASGSCKFSSVIKFSAGSSSVNAPAQDIAEGMTNDGGFEETGTEKNTCQTRQEKASVALARVALENSPAQYVTGSQRDTGGRAAGTPTRLQIPSVVSNPNLSIRLEANWNRDTFIGSPLETSISEGNEESATPRPRESGIINKYPGNSP